MTLNSDSLAFVIEDQPKEYSVHTVSKFAFRPLIDWVDYELTDPIQHQEPWESKFSFELEPFRILEDDPKSKPRSKPSSAKERSTKSGKEVSPAKPVRTPKRNANKRRASSVAVSEDPKRSEREVRQRLAELEAEFLQSNLPFDAVEHHPLWREMAGLHFTLNQLEEGMLCLSHAVWNGQFPDEGFQSVGQVFREMDADELEELLKLKRPTGNQLSRVIGFLVRQAQSDQTENLFLAQTNGVQEFLTRFEHILPVRIAWLAWWAIGKIFHCDILTLARARDRFLERLFQQGVRLERDVPRLLKAGRSDLPGGNSRMLDFRQLIHEWSQANREMHPGTIQNATPIYLDWILAFGLARRGETASARELLKSTREAMAFSNDPLHAWCQTAYEFRIQQTLNGEDFHSALPAELLDSLQKFPKREQFKLDRLRQGSRILEPRQSGDSFLKYHQNFADDLARELAEFQELSDPAELTARWRTLQASSRTPSEQERLLIAGLELAPKLGSRLAHQILEQSVAYQAGKLEPSLRLKLLEQGLSLAAHFDWPKLIEQHLRGLSEWMNPLQESDAGRVFVLESFLGGSFHKLKRFGLHEELIKLLDQMEQRTQASNDQDHPIKYLRRMLHIAQGRFDCDQEQAAWPILDQVRKQLQTETLHEVGQTKLAKAYLETLSSAPLALAGERFREFFQTVRGVCDGYSTSTHFFLSQIQVVEAWLFAMPGDADQSDPATRRLLEEEEFCVRQRIHRDLRIAISDD